MTTDGARLHCEEADLPAWLVAGLGPLGRRGRTATAWSFTSRSRPTRRRTSRCAWRSPATCRRRSRRPAASSGAPIRCGLRRRGTRATDLAGTSDAFAPDTDTRRPEVSDYDDPFTPSTAPFKRLEAFDAVLSDYHVEVRDPRLVRLAALQGGAPPSADEDAFFADLVVDLPPEGSVRIPSVGPGARVVHARLGVGETAVPFQILRDGADNWFLQPAPASGGPRALGANGLPKRAQLVMEVAIARAAFGGAPGDVGWSELPFVPPLPDNVARDAAVVRAAIGVSRAMRPREAIAKLVDYFRGFADSDEPPRRAGSVYLDLALSKKGVCRHRAYAFLITAQSLGIPTRLVENEAHAWVEIHDGTLWRRIDLGGAGRLAARGVESNRAARPVRGAARRVSLAGSGPAREPT